MGLVTTLRPTLAKKAVFFQSLINVETMKILVATEKPFAKAAVDGIREIIEGAGYELALLEKYADSGIYEIEDMDILKLDPFVKFGKPAKIASLFGGREGYIRAVRELEQEIYKAA